MLYRAMQAISDIVAGGGRVLMVGTKRQASTPISEAARRCGQYYVNHRWLGGMMTNWRTISNSIQRLHSLDETLAEDNIGLTKKELLRLTRERDKLERALGGIKEMGGLPDIIFVVDTNKESIAVSEANNLGIPVVGIIDSNSSPEGIDFPVPGNDDSLRAITLYCDLISGSVLSGIQQEITDGGGDIGAGVEAPQEELPVAEAASETAETPVVEPGAKPDTETDSAPDSKADAPLQPKQPADG